MTIIKFFHYTLNNYKYKRTYINGSKKNEKNIFHKVENDKKGVNYFDYIPMSTRYYRDLYHVIYSWKILMFKLSFILFIAGVLLSLLKFIILSKILFSITIISAIIHLILAQKEKKCIADYDKRMRDITDNMLDDYFNVQ